MDIMVFTMGVIFGAIIVALGLAGSEASTPAPTKEKKTYHKVSCNGKHDGQC